MESFHKHVNLKAKKSFITVAMHADPLHTWFVQNGTG